MYTPDILVGSKVIYDACTPHTCLVEKNILPLMGTSQKEVSPTWSPIRNKHSYPVFQIVTNQKETYLPWLGCWPIREKHSYPVSQMVSSCLSTSLLWFPDSSLLTSSNSSNVGATKRSLKLTCYGKWTKLYKCQLIHSQNTIVEPTHQIQQVDNKSQQKFTFMQLQHLTNYII